MKKFDTEMQVQSNAMTALTREITIAARGPDSNEIRAIGKKMKALDMSKQADATSRALVQAALANGAAQALPR